MNDEELVLMYEVGELETQLKNDFPQLQKLELVLRSKDNIFVNQIRIRAGDRGKGYGSAIMRIIDDFAKKRGMYVTLMPYPDNPRKYKKKLIKFYKRLGYIPNRGKYMMPQYSHPTMATMIKKPLHEVINLPPDMDKKVEILGGFIGSFFIKYFENKMKHIKTATREWIVKYAEYLKLAKQYRDVGSRIYVVESTDELIPWGKANFRIRARDESMPHIILKIAGGYSESHNADIDETKDYAEVRLLVDTQHFVKSFKKSVADTTETLRHEVVHVLQLTDPEKGEINKYWGMPKDKIMSKDRDIFGRKTVNGRTGLAAHPMRDVEFKPNLFTYSYYIRNYLNRNFSISEWKDMFKKIVMGYEVNSDNEIINNYSFGLGHVRHSDHNRWKQFVKELYIMVFSPKKEELQESIINLSNLLTEDRSNQTARKGCLMAMIPQDKTNMIVNFGKKLIKEEDLYLEGNEYGRETEGHVTIRYGFLKDLNELEIRQLIRGQKPFIVELVGLDKFDTNPKYDVAKFMVSSPVLKQLNEMSGIYLNENEYGEYNPHLTLAYVQKGKFPYVKEGFKLQVPITQICYGPIQGAKSYFDL